MSLEDIEFHKSGRLDRPGLGLYLRGYWVGKTTMEMAWAQISKSLPAPNNPAKYTARMMCGEAFWKPPGRKRALSLGRSIKYFVDQEMLPLYEANPRKKGSRKYIRIN